VRKTDYGALVSVSRRPRIRVLLVFEILASADVPER
jgi:hypothetical protein